MIKHVKNMHGMSFVEIVVALGLLGGIGYGGMTLVKNQLKAQRTVEQGHEVSTTIMQIKALLNSVENCTASFKNLDPATGSAGSLKKKTLSGYEDIYEVDTQVPGNLYIKSIRLDNTIPNLASDETALKIAFSREKNSNKEEIQKILRVQYKRNGANLIDSCYTLTDNNEAWQRANNPLDIYYDVGKVGVGTNNPKAALHVNGHLKLGTPGVCDADNEGAIAYDYGLHKQVVCAGEPLGWKSAGVQKPQIVTKLYRGSGTGSVECPADFTIVGGGCDFDSNATTTDLTSKPINNGWYCGLGLNPNPGKEWDTFVYAVCVPN